MKDDAPLLHDDLFTANIETKPTKPSNIAKRVYFAKGDAESAFKGADVIVEGRYTTVPVHQAYIEPHACVVQVAADGQAVVYSSSQGQFMVRAYCAKLLGWDLANIRAVPLEIGGGFGGKTLIYLEPLALALSKKTGRGCEDADDAGGSVPRLRPDFRFGHRGQDRRQEGWHHRRRERGAEVSGGRLPRLAHPARLHVRLRDVQHPECRGAWLRRRLQPAEGRGLPRPRRADVVFRC